MRRACVTVVAIAAFVGVTPAMANAEPPRIGVFFQDTTLAPGTPGRDMSTEVLVPAGVSASVRLVFDTSGLAGIADLRTDDPVHFTCTSAPDVTTCESESPIAFGGGAFGGFVLVPAAGATAGQAGRLAVSATADGLGSASHTANVRIGEAVELTTPQPPVTISGAPGDRLAVPMTVRNAGDSAVRGVVLLVFSDFEMESTDVHSNCQYHNGRVRSCTFADTLEPGASYQATDAFRIRSDAQAPTRKAVQFGWLTPADYEDLVTYLSHNGFPTGTPGAGEPLALRAMPAAKGLAPPQTDPDPADAGSEVFVDVTGNHQTDLAAVGATLAGSPGTITEVSLGVKNLGPVTLNGDRTWTNMRVTLPGTTTALDVSERCTPIVDGELDNDNAGEPGFREYLCYLAGGFFAVDDADLLPFKLRIDATGTSTGTVELNDPLGLPYAEDINPANDTAQIHVNPPAGGGGTLPITGVRTGLFAGGGVVLLAVGAMGYALARRRRVRFTT